MDWAQVCDSKVIFGLILIFFLALVWPLSTFGTGRLAAQKVRNR